MSTKIEFAVQMTCESCVKAVKKSLDGVEGVNNVNVNLTTGSVIVETSLPSDRVLKLLEGSGRKVALRGYGLKAAVAILDTGNRSIKGVVRFVQEDSNICIIDGTIDGLQPGKHKLSVHECGDLSQGCDSVGNFFHLKSHDEHRIYGDLGNIEVNEDGRAAFRIKDDVVKLPDIIGRSLVVSEVKGGARASCGVIARSSGLFQNPKTICACDGVNIWNESIDPKTDTM